jgi:hypothetical protein
MYPLFVREKSEDSLGNELRENLGGDDGLSGFEVSITKRPTTKPKTKTSISWAKDNHLNCRSWGGHAIPAAYGQSVSNK